MRRPSLVLACALGLTACGATAGPAGHVTLRHSPAEGSSIRYHVVATRVPGDVPGETVTGMGALQTDASGQRLTLNEIHVARGRSVIDVEGRLEVQSQRDARGQLAGEPNVEGGNTVGADALLRAAVGDAVHFPEASVGVGDTWALTPANRPVGDGVVAIPRQAHLRSIEAGIATVEIHGERARESVAPGLAVSATLSGRARIRVADGLLVQQDAESVLTLYATLGDADVGQREDRFVSHVQRVAGPMPGPEEHPSRPSLDATCSARLAALGSRFEHAPRTPIGALDMELREAADGRDLLEEGPVIAGTDAASMAAAISTADMNRAVVAYIATPYDVDANILRDWLADVPSYIELRRLVLRPVDPPAPRPSAAVASTSDPAPAVRAHLALCQPALDALDEHGLTSAARSPIHTALERCGCQASALPDLEALLDRALGGPALGWIPLR
ncbi:MAG: hypothetical protein AB8I08_27280 [Sandaracinaceae bacterium]